MLLGSMVADIVEDSEIQTGRRSEGIFFAGISFIRKLSQGVGVFFATIILSTAKFVPGTPPDQVSEASLKGLGWGYSACLLAAWMLMLLCVSFYRISKEQHEENLRTLAVRNGEAGGS